ncbi:hypothetical protein T4A_3166 [Trichinella pseudospiralis]|uniref:Uncharacterized protein n=1 Tax=Trichinella pseudospiralis TaxID=6337 RepID=A0A0V1GAQ7_TRIPS|nr:hypothetical protein T4A_3166 [Trichinella pseudospiralis]KRY95277.1 hypothetical protein T4C_8111 [Trichinella pseudospiralis]
MGHRRDIQIQKTVLFVERTTCWYNAFAYDYDDLW